MSFWNKLFSKKKPQPGQRVRVCVECGMPVADHKEWCSILRGQREYQSPRGGRPRRGVGPPDRPHPSVFLKKSIVRCQASLAAASSYRGVVSLWKPWLTPS